MEKEIQETGAWPGGWFVYQDGRVEGPFSAEDAFSLPVESEDGKPRLVSRKGFSQWYPLKDLAEIFKVTEQLGRKAKAAAEAGAASLEREMQTLEALRQRHVTPPPPPMREASIVVQRQAEPSRSKTSLVQPVSEAPTPAKKAKDARPDVSSKTAMPANAASTHAASKLAETGDNRILKEAAPSAGNARALVMHEYFLQRGRMRLGKLRNPWLSGFFGVPLTLGGYWMVWFYELAREVAFHVHGSHRPKMPPALLAIVPGVHVYMVYKLARLVREMEEQNKYRSISPGLAALFALIPPFAVTYLQDAVNRHWMMHVKFALSRKRRDGE